MKKFIVTTTINNVTPALKKFDQMNDWHLVVVGDKKTPNIKLQNGTYIDDIDQEKLGFECTKYIPWNVIQRRNLGYLFALKEGADIIATIDDDNIPYDNWEEKLYVGRSLKRRTLSADLVCDSLYEHRDITHKKIWHRGYPIQLLEERYKVKDEIRTGFVDVQAGLWDGDPDIDAVCRIAGGPFDIKFEDKEFLIDNRCYSPYNTQNTIFTRRIAPSMCLLFDIGRMDDIWASYMSQRIMREIDSYVMFTGPTVYQDRNEHDLSVDLKAEMIGYTNSLKFINHLDKINFKHSEPIDMYEEIVESISRFDFITKEITDFQKAWLRDVRNIL